VENQKEGEKDENVCARACHIRLWSSVSQALCHSGLKKLFHFRHDNLSVVSLLGVGPALPCQWLVLFVFSLFLSGISLKYRGAL
jgi:hypothetical protein